MMKKLHTSNAPHIHSGASTSRIMLDVTIAMLPASIAAVVLFGLPALWIILTCVASAVASEFLFNLAVGKKQTVGDLSAVVTGLLLALNLSTRVPLWQCAIGSVFAIVVVKCFFGGLGKNIVNPAITARVLMLLTFGVVAGGANPVIVELTSSATPLDALNQGVEGLKSAPSIMSLLLGTHGGAIGETCAVALLLGGIYLLVRRVITWHVPVAFIGTVFVASFLAEGMDAAAALAAVLSGGLLIGAIFMATDYVTSPSTPWGKIIFGLGTGLITFMIRELGIYPEGVSFAILFMNIITPYISSWTKRKVFGTGGNKA